MSLDAEYRARFNDNREKWNDDVRDRLRASLASFRGQTIVLDLHDGRRMSATIAGVDQDEIQVVDQGDARIPPPKPITTIALDQIREARLP